MNLDNLFSDDFDRDDDIFKTVVEAEDEDMSDADDSDDDMNGYGFDYLCKYICSSYYIIIRQYD